MMNTKILYVLVSKDTDVYWEQSYISMTSLRRVMPDAHITLLTDDVTDSTFVGVRDKIHNLVTEKIVIKMDSTLTNKVRSRLLKTNMRNYVDGDFLFIDADTIIMKDLSDIDKYPHDMGAVLETHKPIGNNSNKTHIIEAVERFGLKLTDESKYYNSGVFYVRDTPQNREFFKSWLETWQYGAERLNVVFDQMSLAVVNDKYGNIIQELPGYWNCLGKYCMNYVKDAKLFHYFYDAFFDFPMINKDTFSHLKQTGEIDEKIEKIMSDPFAAISGHNELVTGKIEDILHTRIFALIRVLYYKHNKLFGFIETMFEGTYNMFLKLTKKNRMITPPRKH